MKSILKRRFLAWLIDDTLYGLIAFTVSLLIVATTDFSFSVDLLLRPSISAIARAELGILFLLFTAVPLCWDLIFGGISPGKRLCCLRIIEATTGKKPRITALLLRGILFFFAPLSGLVALVSNGRSLADLLSGTAIVKKM